MQLGCLLISSSEKGEALLLELLTQAGLQEITVARSGEEARQQLLLHAFELMVINGPLSDEFGYGLALQAASSGRDVLLLAKAEQLEAVCGRLGNAPVLVVPKPLKRVLFLQTLRFLLDRQQQRQALLQEHAVLQQKIQEISLLNRAKLVLMQVLKMTESQAHRYIEKQAMDMRISKREVAEGVLKTYEN